MGEKRGRSHGGGGTRGRDSRPSTDPFAGLSDYDRRQINQKSRGHLHLTARAEILREAVKNGFTIDRSADANKMSQIEQVAFHKGDLHIVAAFDRQTGRLSSRIGYAYHTLEKGFRSDVDYLSSTDKEKRKKVKGWFKFTEGQFGTFG